MNILKAEVRDWSRDPSYAEEGPCGQVLEFLEQCGHRQLAKAPHLFVQRQVLTFLTI